MDKQGTEQHQEKEANKEILIRRNHSISFDSEGVYRNGTKVEDTKVEGSKDTVENYEGRAKAEVQSFYNEFFRQSFKHIVVLAAAGTSLDNGGNNGKTRNGLWEEGKVTIEKLCNTLWASETEKSKRITKDKDIEALLSHVLLVEKTDEEKAKVLKPLRNNLEKIIRKACKLTLDNETVARII